MGEKYSALAEGALAIPVFIITAIFAVAAFGLVFPVVNTHCLVDSNINHPRIESGWKFNWIGGGFPNPAPDGVEGPEGDACVRNTPTREALSALGIWKLGSPEHQIATNVLE